MCILSTKLSFKEDSVGSLVIKDGDSIVKELLPGSYNVFPSDQSTYVVVEEEMVDDCTFHLELEDRTKFISEKCKLKGIIIIIIEILWNFFTSLFSLNAVLQYKKRLCLNPTSCFTYLY